MPSRDAYTFRDARDEGIRDAIHDQKFDGIAVSRTQLDREAVFFCARMKMSRGLLLRGGRVVDPASALDRVADVRVHDGVIAAVGTLDLQASERVVDVTGLVVAPGLIDVHVHLREPGQEWKETVGTGTAAAAAGGFTTVFCMPNTLPALDSVVALEELKRRTDRDALVRVRPIAAISEERRGDRPVDFEALVAAGAVGFSDDGETTRNSGLMCEALQASRALKVPIMVHCEDPSLTGGSMHEGETSRKLGLAAIPAAAEEIIIARDLALAAITGGWLHVCHVSTGIGADLIAAAKCRGDWVTAEVMPHHLTMTNDWVAGCREFVNVEEPVG
ncbi:MAG TPA: amidohydrolase family protein, partial [Thermomicrobiales bacterium]|nr:amidohydrolase family protein [Thermomicrobiales bacterium]